MIAPAMGLSGIRRFPGPQELAVVERRQIGGREPLHRKMVETRAEKPRQFQGDAPEFEQICGWIDAAKSMEPAVTH